jgi:hypothetical protein
MVQALSENAPVLYVAFDIEARGPVGTMQPSRGVFAGALVISPEARASPIARLAWEVCEDATPRQTQPRPENAALVEGNAMANGLTLFEVLADGVERDISQTLAPHLSLRMRVTPIGVLSRPAIEGRKASAPEGRQASTPPDLLKRAQ